MKETTRKGFEKLAQIKNTGRFEKTIQIKKMAQPPAWIAATFYFMSFGC